MKQIITLSIILFFLLIPAIVISQAAFSKFLPNAQAIGIGGSNVALAYDPSASYWNPASIAFLTINRVLVNIDHNSYLNHVGFTKFFPPSFAMGLNIFRSTNDKYHYDMAAVALGGGVDVNLIDMAADAGDADVRAGANISPSWRSAPC